MSSANGQIPQSSVLRAAADLKAWLNLTFDDVATITGTQSNLGAVHRIHEVHALVRAVRNKLGPDQAGDWFRTGAPSPLQMLQIGDFSAAQETAYDVLFRRARRERHFAGYSPYDPETDFVVGSPPGQQFRRANRATRRGRLPQP